MNGEATFRVSLPNFWCLIPLGLEEKRVHRVFVKETVCVCLFFVFLKIVNDLSVLNMLCPRAEFSALLSGIQGLLREMVIENLCNCII